MVPEDWERVETVAEYETGWYTGGYDLLRQPDGTEKKYYWAELPPAVVVVAREDDHLVMVEQYRPAIRELCLELPAGIVEDVDSPTGELGGDIAPAAYESAAARELEEETGRHPETTVFVEDFWVSTGVLRHRRGHVVATDLSPAERELDSNEFIEVRRIPVADAYERAREEPSNDATIEGVMLADREGLL